MPHYFTREEAEALLAQIAVVLEKVRDERKSLVQTNGELEALRMQAAGNGHNLHDRMTQLQDKLSMHAQTLRQMAVELDSFGCELKDPDIGLIDFLSIRNGSEIYLCWMLGEVRINFWHYLHTGFAGRQPLD